MLAGVDFEEFDRLSEPLRERYEADMASGEMPWLERRIASVSELASVEALLGVVLPVQYKAFMTRYGCAEFGFVELLPVAGQWPDVPDSVARTNSEEFPDGSFVAVAPVGTGDYWGFPVVDGRCLDEVWWRYHDDPDDKLEASDFLEFVARHGLRLDL
jgi:antitoxin YobK